MSTLPSNLIDDAVLLLADGFNTGKDAFSDGIQIVDMFKFIPQLLAIQGIVEQKDELLAQIKDYSITERAETIEKVKARLNLTDEDAKAIVGFAFDTIFAVVSGILYFTGREKQA